MKFIKTNIKYIIIILIVLLIIGSYIYLYKHRINTKPSDADINFGLTNTYKNVSNIKCKYVNHKKYNNDYYYYNCEFDYKINYEDENMTNKSSCVECSIEKGKWKCSIGSHKCAE